MRVFLLTVHIGAGSLALLTAPLAMLAPKRPGWHPRLGRAYQVLVGLLCLSAGGLVVLNPGLWGFAVIATLTWAAALGGWWMRRRQPRGWLQWHVSLMCGSYISLVTALLVVNLGTRSLIAWILPTAVGTPLITWKNIQLARRPPATPAGTATPARTANSATSAGTAAPATSTRAATPAAPARTATPARTAAPAGPGGQE
jgi:hypothetical protein